MDEDERVSKKVIIEHSASSGSGKQVGIVIIVLVVVALGIIGFIFMRMH